ncbi:MAG: hypothetical protein BWY14_01312 [Parcubacteria group bacterium ADurb.Bin192]|nr:MAG: hypothetical protein BWY14_01312 [Parcubacteria group bacterium ADurb.Bin192]
MQEATRLALVILDKTAAEPDEPINEVKLFFKIYAKDIAEFMEAQRILINTLGFQWQGSRDKIITPAASPNDTYIIFIDEHLLSWNTANLAMFSTVLRSRKIDMEILKYTESVIVYDENNARARFKINIVKAACDNSYKQFIKRPKLY